VMRLKAHTLEAGTAVGEAPNANPRFRAGD
jgi:hypothetical protein